MSSLVVSANQSESPQSQGYHRWLVAAWLGTVAFVLAWSGLIMAAPILEHTGHTALSATIYTAFRPICHQIPERSFHIFGEQLAVCARCSGIYFGFAAGIIMYPVVRRLNDFNTPSRLWLLLAPIPTAIDFALTFFGIWENTHWSRFITAALFGVVAAIYVVPGLMDITQMIWQSVTKRGTSAVRGPAREVVITGGGVTAPSDYSQPDRRI